ncbi:MAG: hypothetical protein KJ011_07245 [Burkholderiaceae bacterium]|nr:hypothetical protein [Burkholderiaceae bacterium]
MELPVKLAYPPAMYADVTSTLYAWFGPAGGTVQVAATLSVAILAFRTRHLSLRRLLWASAVALLASLLLWALAVAPVNSAWANSAGSSPMEIAAAYERLRSRWEYGHVAAFIAWLTGWFGLVAALTRHDAAITDSAA